MFRVIMKNNGFHFGIFIHIYTNTHLRILKDRL